MARKAIHASRRPRDARSGRRRRPVGEPPPLPRDLHGQTPLWIGVLVLLVIGYWWGRWSDLGGRLQRALDTGVDDAIGDLRHSGIAGAASRLVDLAGRWVLLVVLLRWAVVIALIAFKRWRHFAVFVGSVAAIQVLTGWFPTAGSEGTGIAGHPSAAMAGLAVTLLGAVQGLAPHGRWRHLAQMGGAALLASLALVLLITGQSTLSEVVIGLAFGLAVPILGYRLFTPEAVFPVQYQRGRTAHLDVTGERGAAIRSALQDQLGVEAVAVEPFGLEGSGGSTPLRITLGDGARWFGKLYATNHLRADRWYKLGRTILYGALEDERSFNSVRRMVEYEDHMLRYLRDAGVKVAEPFGFVELTPEREYLLLTSLVEHAAEIQEAGVDDGVIVSGIEAVRGLWEAGVAHRDIKPSNLLVHDGEVLLIDVFFCQVRPSPWRQSVDLANMLLTLALCSEPERVYELALTRFTDNDMAEAFAATRGVTIPGQLRSMLAEDGRDLPEAFRRLAPPRDPIPIQRWTARRLALTGVLLAGVGVVLTTTVKNLQAAGFW